MRYGVVLLALLLAACGSDDMTRNFSVSRDSAQDTIGAAQTPLSMPPDFASRPQRLGALPPAAQDNAQQTDQSTGSSGQDAFLEASGPSASPDVRSKIDQNSGLVYPAPEFVDRVMNWTPPPGYAPLAAPAKKGWFSGWF
jgi:hypothetical protein